MQIASSLRGVCFLLLLFAAAPLIAASGGITLASGQKLTASTSATTTILHLQGATGVAQRVLLKRDTTTLPGTSPTLSMVGEVPGKALVLTDTYPSRPGGLSYCQAGEEQFLRVITLHGKRLRETYHVKLASCRDGIELAQPGLDWSAATRTLVVRWLFSPAYPRRPDTTTILIDASGEPSAAPR